MKTYYHILGVSPTAADNEIKAAYRKLAKENHPDLHPGDSAAEARFKEIGEAWETLGDADKRKKYDAKLAEDAGKKRTPGPSHAPVGKININDLMAEFDNYFSGDTLRGSRVKSAAKGSVDADELFDRFMGIRKK